MNSPSSGSVASPSNHAPVTTPPSANNPFAKGRSSTANASSRHGSNVAAQASRYHESASASSSPVPRADRQPPKHEPPSSRSRYPPRSKASPRIDDDNSDEDRGSSHRRPPPSSRGHSRGHSSESKRTPRRGSDSSTGDEHPSRSSRRYVSRDSDSSTGSVEKSGQKTASEFEGGTSSEVTPRVVEAVGSNSRRSSKEMKQKVLQKSNRKNSAEGRRNIQTSASTTAMPSSEHSSFDSRRPVTSADKRNRNISSSSSRRHDRTTSPELDEMVITESYFDLQGIGYDGNGQRDGRWRCLRPSCQNISNDESEDYCQKCATRRGVTGMHGDNVRLSVQK